MKASVVRKECMRIYRKYGIWGLLRRGCGRISLGLRQIGAAPVADMFDQRFGTDTGGVIPTGALDLPSDRQQQAVRYQTAKVEVFTALLNELPVAVDDFVFIDLGSGKGRALLLSSRMPFKEIVGVELSETLDQIARRNISNYRDKDQKCKCIRTVCQDVTQFDFPSNPTVVYMFNPFDETIMREVLERMEFSLRKAPRDFYVLYLKPEHRRIFDESKCFRLLKETVNYAVYEHAKSCS